MAKPRTVEELAAAVQGAIGTRLIALLLFGSGARGGEQPRGAGLDTLLIVDAVDDALFAALEGLIRDWRRGGHPAPIILSDAEWRDSSDVFAIEYQDMREAHRLLAGRDPWAGVTVQRADVRRQVEQELLGKLVRLRQAYVALRGEPRALGGVLAGTLGGFLTMLRTVLRLAGRTPSPAADAVVREAAALVGFHAEPVVELLEGWRSGAKRLGLRVADPRAAAYLAAVARTVEYVNAM